MQFEALNELIDHLSNEYERRRSIKEAGSYEDSALSAKKQQKSLHHLAVILCSGTHAVSLRLTSVTPRGSSTSTNWIRTLETLVNAAHTFTPQWQTANRFATYFKHIAPLAEIALLQIAVPNNFLEPLSKSLLLSEGDSSKTWKRLVWGVRGRKPLGEDLTDSCERDLCVAHILVSENARFDAVDGYATLQSSDDLRVEVDGEWQKAEQWTFSQWNSGDDFAELCKGKCWVHTIGRLINGAPE